MDGRPGEPDAIGLPMPDRHFVMASGMGRIVGLSGLQGVQWRSSSDAFPSALHARTFAWSPAPRLQFVIRNV